MADVELVIKIPEELYDIIINPQKLETMYHAGKICEAVRNGIPLPKGHGELIDTNEITAFRELECNGHNVESLDEFTTIIEADKEEDQ